MTRDPVAAPSSATEPHDVTLDGSGLATKVPAGVLAHIDRYRIVRVLGMGGMGVVYDAYDPELARPVALKLLLPAHGDEATRERAARRLLREAQAMAQVSHPNVVAVYDVGVVDGHVFVAMERVQGETLAAWLRTGPHAWRELLRVFLQAAEGLAAAHAVGLVHRDFKPENVMLGSDGRVRVLDFGLARVVDDPPELPEGSPPASPVLHELATAGAAGTPAYMAPEQYHGGVIDPRTDQFAFCVAVYRAIYGQHPFSDGSAREQQAAVVAGQVRRLPPRRRAPRRLEAILRRGMARARGERHADMPTLIALLRRVLQVSRRRRAAIAVAAGVAVAAAWVAWPVSSDVPLRSPAPAAAAPGASLRQARFTATGDAEFPAFSADGTQLAFIGKQGVFVSDVATRAPRLLCAGHFKLGLSWSTDGQQLITIDADYRVILIDARSGLASVKSPASSGFAGFTGAGRGILFGDSYGKKIEFASREGDAPPTSCAFDVAQRWIKRVAASPDGRWLAVVVSTKEGDAVWIAGADCGSPRRIHASPDRLHGLAWEPDASSLYVIHEGEGAAEILRIGVDRQTGQAATEPQPILGGLDLPSEVEGSPISLAVRPGRRLAYVRENLRVIPWLVHRTGTPAPRALSSAPRLRYGVAISGSGKELAFIEASGGRKRAVVLSLPDGAPKATIEIPQQNVVGLTWAPDDHALALMAADRKGDAHLWIAPLDGTPPTPIQTVAFSSTSENAMWLADGRIGVSSTDRETFRLVDPETGKASWLSDPALPGWMFYPVPTPDGRAVVVCWNRPDGLGLWRIPLDGSAPVLMAPSAYPQRMLAGLAFSPDGRWLYAAQEARAVEDGGSIVRVPAGGGAPEPLWDVKGEQFREIDALPGGDSAVAMEWQQESDLWLAEWTEP